MIAHSGEQLCYFISDLHLASANDAAFELFVRFAQQEALKAQHLYILGDLFEAWIGDDAPTDSLQPILSRLRRLSDNGTQLYIMHGNRDFLLGDQFTKSIGAKLLPEYTVINLFGTSTLLLHGDSLCTDDAAYQEFRAQVRDANWQQEFLSQPLASRRAYAEQARGKSGEYKAQVEKDIMDVNDDDVTATMARYQVQQMIHGHTHRPAVHHSTVGSRTCVRYVLGDWSDNALIVRATHKQTALIQYSLSGFAE